MPIVKFVNEKKEIEVPQGANLRQEALRAGVQLYSGPEQVLNCRGLGSCGTCRVLIQEGKDQAGPRTFKEKLRMSLSLAYIGHEDSMRLACQTKVNGDLSVVTRPDVNLYGENFFS